MHVLAVQSTSVKFEAQPIFMSDPSPESDAAWDNLMPSECFSSLAFELSMTSKQAGEDLSLLKIRRNTISDRAYQQNLDRIDTAFPCFTSCIAWFVPPLTSRMP
jgi:hypothetical protein